MYIYGDLQNTHVFLAFSVILRVPINVHLWGPSKYACFLTFSVNLRVPVNVHLCGNSKFTCFRMDFEGPY